MAQNNGYLNPFVCVCACVCERERTFNIQNDHFDFEVALLLPDSRDSSLIAWNAETLQ